MMVGSGESRRGIGRNWHLAIAECRTHNEQFTEIQNEQFILLYLGPARGQLVGLFMLPGSKVQHDAPTLRLTGLYVPADSAAFAVVCSHSSTEASSASSPFLI